MSWRASGLKAWVWQRLSAVYLALYLIALMAWVALNAPFTHSQWLAAFSSLKLVLPTALAVACLLIHAWVGLRDIVLDYLRAPVLRFSALGVIALFLIAMGLWALFILSRSLS